MAKANKVEEPPIEYRIDGVSGTVLMVFAMIGDAVAMTIALMGFVLSLTAIAVAWIPFAGPLANGAGWAVGLMGSLFSLIISGILMFGFWWLRVHNLTRKIARLGIRLIMKMIPILGMFAVFLTSNTALTWSIIKLSRAEDRFKWLRTAEQMFVAKVALTNRELNANAWKRLTDTEKAVLQKTGFNIDNIESSAFGKELIDQATKEKIGARDLLPHLRKAKTAGDVEKGLASIGLRQTDKRGATGIGGDLARGVSVDGIKTIAKSIDARRLGTTDELDEEQLKKLQTGIDAQNKYNNFQQFYSGLSPAEKKRFDEASDEEKEDMLKEFGLKGESFPTAGERDSEVDDARGLANGELDSIDMDNAKAMLRAADNDAIMKYASALTDEDYVEALTEAQTRLLESGGGLPQTERTDAPVARSIGGDTDAKRIEALKVKIFKKAMQGADVRKLIKSENVQPVTYADELETEIIDAENIAKRRIRALEALNSDDLIDVDLGDEEEETLRQKQDEIDLSQLAMALRGSTLSNSQVRSLMRAKSSEFGNIVRGLGADEMIRARKIRFGQWMDEKAGQISRAREKSYDELVARNERTARAALASIPGAPAGTGEAEAIENPFGTAGARSAMSNREYREIMGDKSIPEDLRDELRARRRAEAMSQMTEGMPNSEYRAIMDDVTVPINIREQLRAGRRQQALERMGQTRDEIQAAGDKWLKDALSGDKLTNEEKRDVLVKVKRIRTDIIENPATPESRRQELQDSLDDLDNDFRKYLNASGLEEV